MHSEKILDENLPDLLAQARALYFASLHNIITRKQAEMKIEPILQKLNQTGKQIAKKYKRKYIPITFRDLGKNF